MTAPTDRYREWDAAYVMGALSRTERREYEQHCAECDDCSKDVADLAGISGILSKVPAAQAMAMLVEDGPPVSDPVPASLYPRVVTAARKAQFRSRIRTAGLLVAAAAVVGIIAVIASPFGDDDNTTTYVMQQTVESPVTAETTLVEEDWGTTIQVTCKYADEGTTAAPGQPEPPFEYALYVTDKSGATTEQATWMAGPGSVTNPVATTSLALDDIASIDIRWVPGDVVILEATP